MCHENKTQLRNEIDALNNNWNDKPVGHTQSQWTLERFKWAHLTHLNSLLETYVKAADVKVCMLCFAVAC